MSNTQTNKPTHEALYAIGNGRSTRWIKIGAVFSNEEGKGMTVLLDAIPLNFDGRIVLCERKEKEAPAEA